MSLKQDFIKQALKSEVNFSRLCQDFGISRKAGYRLIACYKSQGTLAFKPASKRPKSCPHQTSRELEQTILALRDRYPRWGCDKLRFYLVREGYQDVPSRTTVHAILKRYGRISAEESEKRQAWQRFEHEHPNDLWQLDFKGQFKVGERYCYPLTLLDDHSRYLLLLKSCEDQRGKTVKEALIGVFREQGLPRRMTMDNGPPWGYGRKQTYTALNAWMIRLGIGVSHSRPGHPQTQGKLERLHRSLKEELLALYTFDNLDQAQKGFEYWQELYNTLRPHQALSYDVPKQRYRASPRSYPEVLPPIEYGQDLEVRKVQHEGDISYRGKRYHIGEAFYGEPVGLKPAEEEGLMEVYYCHQKIFILDLRHPWG